MCIPSHLPSEFRPRRVSSHHWAMRQSRQPAQTSLSMKSACRAALYTNSQGQTKNPFTLQLHACSRPAGRNDLLTSNPPPPIVTYPTKFGLNAILQFPANRCQWQTDRRTDRQSATFNAVSSALLTLTKSRDRPFPIQQTSNYMQHGHDNIPTNQNAATVNIGYD